VPTFTVTGWLRLEQSPPVAPGTAPGLVVVAAALELEVVDDAELELLEDGDADVVDEEVLGELDVELLGELDVVDVELLGELDVVDVELLGELDVLDEELLVPDVPPLVFVPSVAAALGVCVVEPVATPAASRMPATATAGRASAIAIRRPILSRMIIFLPRVIGSSTPVGQCRTSTAHSRSVPTAWGMNQWFRIIR
jgi:hypothetical protein